MREHGQTQSQGCSLPRQMLLSTLSVKKGGELAVAAGSHSNMPMKDIYNANNLYDGFMESRKGVEWKESVQKYEAGLLLNIYNTRKALMDKTYKTKPMTEFILSERGHTRHIKAQHISDRVVQRSFNDNVLIPKVRPKLIYDNGASLKGKGLSFSRKRFEIHLRKAYKEYGENAYILLMDFRKYYDNVRHNKAFGMFSEVLDAEELAFLKLCFKDFQIDASYMTGEEYSSCMDKLFNALEYSNIPRELKTGRRYIAKSLGIGNQSAQVTGIFYPNQIDHYCKTVRAIKYYGRYMDDTYIILPSKEALLGLYEEIRAMCDFLGIFIHEEKTCIKKITGWITWLKVNYKLKLSGGLIRKVHSSAFRRERRKLNKFHRLYRQGKMELNHIRLCYQSWRGSYKKYDSGIKLKKMDEYFEMLFGKE